MSARSMLTGLLLILINTYSGQSRRCQNQDTSVPCPTVKQINSTECHSAGCCWDANNTACYQDNVYNSTTSQPTRIPSITLTSATQKSGHCIQYNRPACRALLNDSETQNTTRFIDSRYGIGRTEQLLSVFLGVIEKQVKEKEHDCKRLLKVIVCQFVLPRCDAHNVPKNYCREDCDAIFDKCNLELSQLLAVIQYVVDQTNIELVHLAIPNCTQFRYSYESDDTCDHFGLFDFQASSSSPPAKKSYAIVIGASVGVSLLVAFIVIIAIVVRRSFLKKQCDYKGVTFTAVTMRDRLRADTIMALDEMKVMSLYNPDDLIQYPLDKVEYVKDLGEGNFGQVFQGRVFGLRPLDKPETELMVAVKTLKSGCSKEMKVAFLKEVTMMSVLHHENIVELLAVSTEEEPYGMIFEFMANGDLNQYLRTKGPYALEDQESTKENIPSKEDLLSMSLQVANGMEYLQTMRLVHRDLATRNCLVGDGLTVKIADFGMSRDVYASDYYKVEGQAVMPIRWMPPEALLFGKFTVESDVYSYGVLLWEIYTFALQPYYGYTNEEVVDFVKKGVHLGKPDDCEDYIYDVMKYCWNKDPSQRPNFQKIKALLKQEDESAYDLPDEPAATLANPIYQEKLDLQPVVQPVKSSPVLRQNNSSTGYMNVGYKETADQDNSTRKFEEGELEV